MIRHRRFEEPRHPYRRRIPSRHSQSLLQAEWPLSQCLFLPPLAKVLTYQNRASLTGNPRLPNYSSVRRKERRLLLESYPARFFHRQR